MRAQGSILPWLVLLGFFGDGRYEEQTTGLEDGHRVGEQQSHFSVTELSWAELQGELDVVAQVEPVTVVSAPLQLLGGRGSCVPRAPLLLPSRGSFGIVSGSSGAIPVLSHFAIAPLLCSATCCP